MEKSEKELKGEWGKRQRRTACFPQLQLPVPLTSVICALAGIILYAVLMLAQGGRERSITALKRASHGEGELQYSVLVKGLEERRKLPVTISVLERQYTREEADALFEKLLPELTEQILGENESLESVRSDLSLIRQLDPYGFTVRWESENPELLDAFGGVKNAEVDEHGEIVWLRAELTDGLHSREYDIRVRIMPPLLSAEEREKELFMEACIRMDREQQTKEELSLPPELNGKSLEYYVEQEADYSVIPFLGLLSAILFAAREKVNAEKAVKRRERLLLLDYSEVVSKLMVFTGAGMTIRTAWERIAAGYERSREKGTRELRPAYEEMCRAVIQMQSGISEGQAYGDFGRRCGLQPYVKLAALLEQNRKTGGKNLKSALELEMVSAFEQRKNLARKLGEEAGTKLLFPLFMLLGVVMVMIVVPAFLAFY